MRAISEPVRQGGRRRRLMAAVDGFVFHAHGAEEIKRSRLACHPLLAKCPVSVVRRVASVADEVSFAAGDVLVAQGRSAEWFFLIHSGTAELARDGVRLRLLGPGDHVGEVALLGRGMQPATVQALTPMTVSVIGCQRFLPLVQDIRSLRLDMDAALARQTDLVELARAERALRIRAPRTLTGPQPRRTTPFRRPGASPAGWTRLTRPPRAAAMALPVPRRRGPQRTARAAVVAVLAGSMAAAAAAYHPPLAVVSAGPVIDVSHDIAVSGVAVHPARGRYLLLTVRIRRPNLLTMTLAAMHRKTKIVHVDGGADVEATQRRRRMAAQFGQSQTDAAAAAARALGVPVGANGALPFTVRFRHHDIVGPSAGLVYALALEDLLSPADRAHGRTIAATGEVDGVGNVVPVGFVSDKAAAARRAGAQLLLVPEDQADQALGQGIRVQGVGSVEDALSFLARNQ